MIERGFGGVMIYIALAVTWCYVIKLKRDNKKLEFYKEWYIKHKFCSKED